MHGQLGLSGIAPDDARRRRRAARLRLRRALLAAHRSHTAGQERGLRGPHAPRSSSNRSTTWVSRSAGSSTSRMFVGRGPLPVHLPDRRRQGHARPLRRRGHGCLYERNLGGEVLPRDRFASWRIPDGEASSTTRRGSSADGGGAADGLREVPRRRDRGAGTAPRSHRRRGQGVAGRRRARLHAYGRAHPLPLRQPGGRRDRDGSPSPGRHREGAVRARASSSRRRSSERSCRAPCPRSPGVELAAANIPARHIGGDYYDVFALSRGRVGFLVADVSGKGVPAALLVSTVHAAVHLQIDEATTIAELVQRIDRHLRRFAATRKFLTLFFGVLRARHRNPELRLGRPQPGAAPAKNGGSRPSRVDGSARRYASRTRPGKRSRESRMRATFSASTRTG